MDTTETIMKDLAEELAKLRPSQRRIDSLNRQLDKALGINTEDEDLERAEAWERSRR